MQQAVSVISVPLTVATHKRLKTVVRLVGATIAHVARDAVIDKIETLEQKHKKHESEKTASTRTLRKLGESPLGPSIPKTPDDNTVEDDPIETSAAATQYPVPLAPPDPADELLADVYAHHAQRVFDVLTDPAEKRIRIEEAVTALRDEFPIIAPPDEEIRNKLQDVLQRLRLAARAAGQSQSMPSPYKMPLPPLPVLPPTTRQFQNRTIEPLKPYHAR